MSTARLISLSLETTSAFKTITDKFDSPNERRLKSKALAFIASKEKFLSLVSTATFAFDKLANLKLILVTPFQNQVLEKFTHCFYQAALRLMQRAFVVSNEEEFATLSSAITIFTDKIKEFENQLFLLNDIGYANKIVKAYLSQSESIYTSQSLKNYIEKITVTMRLVAALKEHEAALSRLSDSPEALPIKRWLVNACSDICQKFSDKDPNLNVDATIIELNQMTEIVKHVSLLSLEVRNNRGSVSRLRKITEAGVDVYTEGCILLVDALQKPMSVERTNELKLLAQVFHDSASVMKAPTEKNIHALAQTAIHLSGKSSRYKKLLGACCVLGAIVAMSLGIVFAVPTMGLSVAIGLYTAVGLTTCAGIGLFSAGRQKGLSKKVSRLAILQNNSLLLSR